MDRVVSSLYTPTLRALDYARNCASSRKSAKTLADKAVLVKMPTTPSDRDPLNVAKEIVALEEIIQTEFQVPILEKPNRKVVLYPLEQASIAHFSCHGVADVVDPAFSQPPSS